MSEQYAPGDRVIAIRDSNAIGGGGWYAYREGERGTVQRVSPIELVATFDGRDEPSRVAYHSGAPHGPGVRKLTEAEQLLDVLEVRQVEPEKEPEKESGEQLDLLVEAWIAALRNERVAFRATKCSVHAALSARGAERYDADTCPDAVVLVALSKARGIAYAHEITLCAECGGRAAEQIFAGNLTPPHSIRWLKS
jgi:hypothetical protein